MSFALQSRRSVAEVSAAREIFIRRRPEDVFAYFADLRHEPEWNRGHVRGVIMTSRGPIGLGTTFEGHHPGFGKATWRLVDFDPPRHLEIEGTVGHAPYRYAGDLEPAPGGTRFRGCVRWEPRGAWRLLGPLAGAVLNVQARRSFGNLRDVLERTASYRVPAARATSTEHFAP